MKKTRMIIIVACILALGLVFTGCSCSKDSSSTNSTSSQTASNSSGNSSSKDANSTNATNGTDASKSGDAAATANNGSQDAGNQAAPKGTGIVGSFKFDDPGASLVFTFNSDKTGIYDIMGQKMNFTYNDDGSNLNIKFDGDSNVTDTPYTLNGDTLTIKDASGADLVYKRI